MSGIADVIFSAGVCFLMVCGGCALLYAVKNYWDKENR